MQEEEKRKEKISVSALQSSSPDERGQEKTPCLAPVVWRLACLREGGREGGGGHRHTGALPYKINEGGPPLLVWHRSKSKTLRVVLVRHSYLARLPRASSANPTITSLRRVWRYRGGHAPCHPCSGTSQPHYNESPEGVALPRRTRSVPSVFRHQSAPL